MTAAEPLRFPTAPVRFWYAEAFDAEHWTGPFKTRGDAVADATVKLFRPEGAYADVEGFWVASGALKHPDFAPSNEVLHAWLTDFEEADCWFEDGAGFDTDDVIASRDDIDTGSPSLVTALADAFEAWWVTYCDTTVGRMIEDFRTMEFFRRVRTPSGDTTELDPERVP
jgi:hypothetical protein